MNHSSGTPIELSDGRDTCPSCESNSWKSAKMIVLEGTTFTQGTITGDVTDRGKLSGGVEPFLLGDRWFSWSKSFDAEFESTTTNALVLVVRRLMQEHGSMVPMPFRSG